jgi:hypothetical protein
VLRDLKRLWSGGSEGDLAFVVASTDAFFDESY